VDVSLYVRAGAPPTTSVYDCAGVATGNFATCVFDSPQSGIWYALAVRVTGTVAYQITATEFAPLDSDDDGVEDAFDNCLLASNSTQMDLDTDGCGDFCDFDWDNDGIVKAGEVAEAASQSGSPLCGPSGSPPCPGPPFHCCACDFNHDGICKAGEVAQIAAASGTQPGPSGLDPSMCKSPQCNCINAP
jgi:hypothetical protein